MSSILQVFDKYMFIEWMAGEPTAFLIHFFFLILSKHSLLSQHILFSSGMREERKQKRK